jgi:archaellum biogenesis ATPase FlaH
MIEQTILAGMIHNEQYARTVLPFLKDEYFEDHNDKYLYETIKAYIDQYNGLPTKTALQIAVDTSGGLNEERYKQVTSAIDSLSYDEKTDMTWLVNTTEKFCQDKAIYNAVRQSILVLDGKVKDLDKGAIPELLSTALGVSFDTNVGHDFLENSDERFDFYHRVEEKLEFDLEYFNKITKGGLSKKSLSIALAGTGVGKTLFMTHCASAALMSGKNVLYITMEMAEERIAERIDANLLDVTLDDLRLLPKGNYKTKIDKVKERTSGKLIVKEYPTGSAGANHFRHLLNELKLKKKFVPDVIFIDYLNICMSSRLKHGANMNSYTLIKAIAEELRGLAMEFNVPVMSATQTTRSGYGNSDVEITDTSESFGLPATADFMFGLVSTEELEKLGQLMVKQLKNRWGSIDTPKRFIIGIDRSKMRLFDAEESAQDALTGGPKQQADQIDKPIFDNSGMMQDDDFEPRGLAGPVKIGSFKKKKPNFGGFN